MVRMAYISISFKQNLSQGAERQKNKEREANYNHHLAEQPLPPPPAPAGCQTADGNFHDSIIGMLLLHHHSPPWRNLLLSPHLLVTRMTYHLPTTQPAYGRVYNESALAHLVLAKEGQRSSPQKRLEIPTWSIDGSLSLQSDRDRYTRVASLPCTRGTATHRA